MQRENRVVGAGLAHRADTVRRRLLHRLDGLRLALGLANLALLLGLGGKDGRLLIGLGFQDLRLLLALGDRDGGLLFGLGEQHLLALLALGLHLLLHRLLNGLRRRDVLHLDAIDLDAPSVSGLVEDRAHLTVDGIAAGKRRVEIHVADDVAQGSRRQVLKCGNRVFHTVGVQFRVHHLEVDDGVDGHRDVILGDDGLRREIGHLLFKRDAPVDAVDERHHHVQAVVPGCQVATQALDHARLGLRNDFHAHERDDHHDDHEKKQKCHVRSFQPEA